MNMNILHIYTCYICGLVTIVVLKWRFLSLYFQAIANYCFEALIIGFTIKLWWAKKSVTIVQIIRIYMSHCVTKEWYGNGNGKRKRERRRIINCQWKIYVFSSDSEDATNITKLLLLQFCVNSWPIEMQSNT